MTTPSPQATAYSYLRLSSKRQLAGDGFRRQREDRDEFVKHHNLVLDDELCHIGSAFTGANFDPGTALYEFVERVKAGIIPKGSWLIVESLDRLSRDAVSDALTIFQQIIKAGITIGTCKDGFVYTKKSIDDNPFQLLVSIVIMSRAVEESRLKSKRLADAWTAKRAKPDVLSGKGPGWLTYGAPTTEFPSGWHHVPERVASVRRIYQLAAEGVGCGKIARLLNNPPEGVTYATLSGKSKVWHDGTVYPVIGNRAVLGHYQPHKLEQIEGTHRRGKRIPAGDERQGYYGDPIVSPALFEAAVRAIEARGLDKPGNSGGRRGTKRSNLFTGLAVCGLCLGKMQYRPGGNRQEPYLQCAASRYGKCDNRQKPKYGWLEGIILRAAIDGRFDVPVNTNEVRRISDEIAKTKDTIAIKSDAIRRLLTRFEFGGADDDIIVDHVRKERSNIDNLKKSLKSLERSYEAISSEDRKGRRRSAFQMMREDVAKCQSDEEIFIVRTRIADMLSSIIRIIFINDDGSFLVDAKENPSWDTSLPTGSHDYLDKFSSISGGIEYYPDIDMVLPALCHLFFASETRKLNWMRYQAEVRTGRPWQEAHAKMLALEPGEVSELCGPSPDEQRRVAKRLREDPSYDPNLDFGGYEWNSGLATFFDDIFDRARHQRLD